VKCFNTSLHANEIEVAVLIQLVHTFGDPERVQRAIENAIPNKTELDELEKEQKELIDIQDKINKAKNRLIEDSSPNNPNHIFTRDEIRDTMLKYRQTEDAIIPRLEFLNRELESRPDKKHVKAVAKWAGKIIGADYRFDPSFIFKRTFEWRRRLIEKAFSGKDSTGKHLGVYVTFDDNKFTFEIRGLTENTVLALPLTDSFLIDTFHIDSEYQDTDEAIQDIRTKIGLLNVQSKYIVLSS
jgi:hypothetical protein